MIAHLPILPVLLPLLGAPLIMLFNHAGAARVLALLTLLLTAAASAALWWSLPAMGGTVAYALGNWQAPVGIELSVDAANAPLVLLLAVTAVVALLTVNAHADTDLNHPRLPGLFALFLLCVAGLMGMTVTADAFNVFVFLEISSLATYALVAAGPHRRALFAAFQYLMLGTLGGSFVLIGVGLLYQATGSLNMADIAARLDPALMPRVVIAGAAFLLLGFALKSALFPLHAWLPGVYAHAPGFVAVFLAAVATKVAIYAIARFAFEILGTDWLARIDASWWITNLAAAGMVFGATAAVFQTHLRALLAYSSVGQLAYILFGIGLATSAGVSAAYIHMLNHAVIKGTLFLLVIGWTHTLGGDDLERLRGMGRRQPLAAGLLTVGLLSLLGVPLTAGFISKWYLIKAALEAQHVVGVIAIALSSLAAVAYCARILERVWLHPAPDTGDAPPNRLLALSTPLAALMILLGLHAAPVVTMGNAAAAALLTP